jgi:RNA polymerase sigma-70 factor (ECF subfamily)
MISHTGPLADLQRGLFSGFRIFEVQRAHGMEDEREKVAPEQAEPADDFTALFEAERVDIACVCRRLLDDSAAAEDAANEVFLRARRALSSYDSEQPFRPWLRAIASNYCIDQLRRQKTERKLFSRADLTDDGLVDTSPDVLRCLTRNEERREVLAAIDALPAKYRLPLVLRFYRDFDYEAIAELLNITRNQVGSLLFRAKKLLRERLADPGPGSDRELANPDSKPRDSGRLRRRSSVARSNQSEKK